MAFRINPSASTAAAACFAILISIPPLAAQSVGGPSASYVFHAANRSLRQVVGSPGSSYLGETRFSDLDAASISPSQLTALVSRGENTSLVRTLEDPMAQPVEIEGLLKGIDRVLWSEDSSCAVVFSSATRRLQWIRSLDTTPVALAPVSLESLPGELDLLAADDVAAFAYIASREGGYGHLYRVAPDEPILLVAAIGDPVSAAVDSRNQMLYVVDRASRQLRGFSEQKGKFVDASMGTLPEHSVPAAMAIDPITSDLYVVDKDSRSILIYSPESRTFPHQLALQMVPTAFERFGRSGFLLLPAGPGPLFVLRSGKNAEVLFIPAGDQN